MSGQRSVAVSDIVDAIHRQNESNPALSGSTESEIISSVFAALSEGGPNTDEFEIGQQAIAAIAHGVAWKVLVATEDNKTGEVRYNVTTFSTEKGEIKLMKDQCMADLSLRTARNTITNNLSASRKEKKERFSPPELSNSRIGNERQCDEDASVASGRGMRAGRAKGRGEGGDRRASAPRSSMQPELRVVLDDCVENYESVDAAAEEFVQREVSTIKRLQEVHALQHAEGQKRYSLRAKKSDAKVKKCGKEPRCALSNDRLRAKHFSDDESEPEYGLADRRCDGKKRTRKDDDAIAEANIRREDNANAKKLAGKQKGKCAAPKVKGRKARSVSRVNTARQVKRKKSVCSSNSSRDRQRPKRRKTKKVNKVKRQVKSARSCSSEEEKRLIKKKTPAKRNAKSASSSSSKEETRATKKKAPAKRTGKSTSSCSSEEEKRTTKKKAPAKRTGKSTSSCSSEEEKRTIKKKAPAKRKGKSTSSCSSEEETRATKKKAPAKRTGKSTSSSSSEEETRDTKKKAAAKGKGKSTSSCSSAEEKRTTKKKTPAKRKAKSASTSSSEEKTLATKKKSPAKGKDKSASSSSSGEQPPKKSRVSKPKKQVAAKGKGKRDRSASKESTRSSSYSSDDETEASQVSCSTCSTDSRPAEKAFLAKSKSSGYQCKSCGQLVDFYDRFYNESRYEEFDDLIDVSDDDADSDRKSKNSKKSSKKSDDSCRKPKKARASKDTSMLRDEDCQEVARVKGSRSPQNNDNAHTSKNVDDITDHQIENELVSDFEVASKSKSDTEYDRKIDAVVDQDGNMLTNDDVDPFPTGYECIQKPQNEAMIVDEVDVMEENQSDRCTPHRIPPPLTSVPFGIPPHLMMNTHETLHGVQGVGKQTLINNTDISGLMRKRPTGRNDNSSWSNGSEATAVDGDESTINVGEATEIATTAESEMSCTETVSDGSTGDCTSTDATKETSGETERAISETTTGEGENEGKSAEKETVSADSEDKSDNTEDGSHDVEDANSGN